MLQNKLSNLRQFIGLKLRSNANCDLSKYILPVNLENTDKNYKTGNQNFNTVDYVYLESIQDVNAMYQNDRIVNPTAYAIANGTRIYNNGTSSYWLRSAYSYHSVNYVSGDGVPYDKYVDDAQIGVVPAMHLNVEAIVSVQNNNLIKFKVNQSKHTIEFGFYPKVMVSNTNELEKLLKQKQILPTGRKYLGGLQKNGQYAQNLEYKYRDEYYVRMKKSGGDALVLWYKVKPIIWKIKNWNEMPISINPNGKGTATYIDVRTEQIIMGGIPFYPKMFEANNSFWQNSSLRGYLNGLNLVKLENNCNVAYKTKNAENFSKNSFIHQAFIVPQELVELNNQIKDKAQTTIHNPIEKRQNELEVIALSGIKL